MYARRPSFHLSPLAWLRSGLVTVSLTLLTPLIATVQAGMIGTGAAPRAVAVGDINEDGYADLVSGNTSDSTVSVSLGRGNGTFKPKVQYSCGSSVYGVALADLNGDNHLDVVSCCPNIGRVGVRLGTGDGVFGVRTDYSVNSPRAVVARDLNQDGLLDLAVASSTSPFLTVMTATSPGTFGPATTYAGANSSHLAVGDLNNDGRLDIVSTNSSGTGIQVYLSTVTPGLFGSPVNYTMQGASSSVVLTDLNLDGTLDVSAAIPSFGTVNVRLGAGNGTFGANNAYVTGTSPYAIESADFNGDTHPDLAATVNGGSAVSILLGTGSGTFQPKVDYAAGVSPLGIAVGQLDADANLDLAIAASGSNSICTLPGNGNGTFQIPSGPVYVWASASGTAFDPNAWLPARSTGTASDILVFNRGGAVSVTSVPTASIGQMVISGGTEASFSGLFGAATLTVVGGAGDDVVVEQGSRSVLASSGSPVSVNLASGANASILGDVEIRGGINRLQALSSNGVVFQSTGRAIIGPGSSATPFGNGTGPSGFGSVLFHYGSQYIAQAPIAVFGASYPFEVVTLWPGSRFRMDVAFAPDVSGRRYADFEYNVPGGNSAFTGNGPLILDSLIVSQGTLSVQMTGGISIHGNIALAACSGTLRFNPPSPVTYQLGGASRQTVRLICGYFQDGLYISPNVTLDIDNPGDVMINSYLRTSGNVQFTHGKLISHPIAGFPASTYLFQVDSTGVVTGASQSTGWVAMGLGRHVPGNGVLRMDVGDDASYLPIDIDFNGVSAPGRVNCGTTPYDTYGWSGAQLDLARIVQRTWSLIALNETGFALPATFFSSANITFPFTAADLPPGTDPSQLVVRTRSTAYGWAPTTTGTRTPTSIQVTGFFPLGVDGWGFVSGHPITPSLSVTDAAQAEGNGLVASRFGQAHAQTAGNLSFRVRLSQAAIAPVSVDYQTSDGSATEANNDYTPTSGTLNFAPGDTALDIVVPFGLDTTPERNETFGITLSNALNASIAIATATGTILDDDDLIAPTAQVTYPNGGELIYQNQQVNLQWTATDNVAVSGVDIQLVKGASVTTLASNYPNTGSYPWTASGPASNKMKFRVVAHDDPGHSTIDNSDANWELSPLVLAVEAEVPHAFTLAAPSPNPSPARLNQIAFALPHEAPVRLTVYDVRGRMLAKLADGTVAAGRHARIWNSAGVAAGVYFVRFEAPGFRADQRLVLIR